MMIVIMMVLLLSFVFAQAQNSTCSSKGYTIATINGVFTDESGAILNRDALKYYFKDAFQQPTSHRRLPPQPIPTSLASAIC